MVKGVSIALKSYEETIPRVLKVIKLDLELKNHSQIIIKPHLGLEKDHNTPAALVAQIVRFCMHFKNSDASVFIAEGADGADTMELFNEEGYRAVAEKYGVGLIDLNKSEAETIGSNEFVGFETMHYPSMLKDSFIISVPKLVPHDDLHFTGALANMRGVFPGRHYKGLFSSRKSKLDAYPLKYQVHDINVVGMPHLAVIDASSYGKVLVGRPIDMDRQAAHLLSIDPKSVSYLRMIEETLETRAERERNAEPKMPSLAELS